MQRNNQQYDLLELVESFDGTQKNLALQVLQVIHSAEKARLESERIFNASLDILGSLDTEGRFLNINPVLTDILGYTVPKLIGKSLFELLYPNDVKFVEEALAHALKERNASFEVRVKAVDGTHRWLSWVVTADIDNDSLHFVSRDMTRRKEQDKQFEDLRSALDEAAIVAITDVSGKITYVNDKFCDISKYSREELIGQDHRIINSGHHSKEFIRDIWVTIAKGNIWRGEIMNKAKDGSHYWVDTTIVPFLNDQGKPYQYVAIRSEITDRKQAQAQLEQAIAERQQHEKQFEDLRSALDEAAIVAITDVTGKITYVNDKFCDISKYSREELIGQDHRIINSGYHSKEFIRDIWVTIANGNIWRGEIMNKAKDGSHYWVDTTIVPFLNQEGKPYQYVAIRSEITDRMQAQAQLEQAITERREQEKHVEDLRSALDEAAIVAITDVTGKITYVNDKFCDISKYSREELIGQDHRIINSGYHSKEFIRDIWVTIANGNIWRGEIMNKAKDGSHYWVDTTIVPFLNQEGKPYQYVAIRSEITDRMQAQAQLEQAITERREQEKHVEDLRFSLDEAAIVAITDVTGKITYVNEKFCDISQYTQEELIGQDHRIINSGYHSKEFIRDIWVTIANGHVWRGEIMNKAKDGSYYWVDTTIVPFLNQEGKPYQYVAIRYEITDRMQAQTELEQAIVDLQVANRLANENARLKSEFLATMSHELRTPMNAIEGFTSVMLNRMGGAEYNDKTLRYLEKVQNNSRRLLNLINDFLDLSRIEAGRLELSSMAVSPRDMAQKWEDTTSSLAETKHLTFDVSVDETLPEFIYGDEEAISKVVINLLGNAFKFTEQGGVQLSLHHENDFLVIEVADTGIGIPPHAREYIFDEFRQVDQSSRRLFGGTGLGLAIVQKLTRQMGGTITLQSEVGVGSTFTVRIPMHLQPQLS
jgi:PAS domain S-box-containing protein